MTEMEAVCMCMLQDALQLTLPMIRVHKTHWDGKHIWPTGRINFTLFLAMPKTYSYTNDA